MKKFKKFKKFKGTKGDWFLESKTPEEGRYPSKEFVINFSPTIQACISVFSPDDEGIKEDLANARLVAASPNLLEACMDAIRLLERLRNSYGFDIEGEEYIGNCISSLEKALKKALK
jgi:hypothetical protein